MKEKLFSFMFFIGFTSLIFCQEKNTFNNLTSGKWQIESVQIENELLTVSKKDNWMVFYPDGLYEIYLDNEEQVGTWKLDDQNNLKFDLENFNGESDIRELTSNSLNFSISGFTMKLSKS